MTKIVGKKKRSKVLYVPSDGQHMHEGGVGGEHQHMGLELELQKIIDQQFELHLIIHELKEQIAVCHSRIDELELELGV